MFSYMATTKRFSVLAAAGLIGGMTTAWADTTPVPDFLRHGTTQLDLRLRYERVEQDALADGADALTLRTRLGYSTVPVNGFSGFVEFEHTAALIDDYAPETVGHPVVADPEGSELNRYGLQYAITPGLLVSAGRQRLIYDNARWIGNVGWRQNEQTYDGAFLHAGPFRAVTVDAAYLSNVNTVTLGNIDVRAELLRAHWAPDPRIAATAYGYRIDNGNVALPDLDTYGVRLTGAAALSGTLRLRYAAEFAAQRAELGSDRYDTRYSLAELALERDPLALKLGYELLGSDAGDFALQTPLGTRHAFQGWADAFLQTPDAGLRDAYAGVDAKLAGYRLGATYHRFRADETDDDFGRELDAQLCVPLPYALQVQLKLARYRAGDVGVDADKYWLQIEYHL
jgi:hypothetical protein